MSEIDVRSRALATAQTALSDARRCRAIGITPSAGNLERSLAEAADALEVAESEVRRLSERPTLEAMAYAVEAAWRDPTWDNKTLRPIDRRIALYVSSLFPKIEGGGNRD